MPQVFIGLGSNIGERSDNLINALYHIQNVPCRIKNISSIYETEPVGPVPQDFFLNAVVELVTNLDCLPLFKVLQDIEKKMGRVKGIRWGPRIIDIDLLTVDQIVLRQRILMLPHPRLASRRFVLVPFAEIAPGHQIPGTGKTVQELLSENRDHSDVNFFMSSCVVWKKLEKGLS